MNDGEYNVAKVVQEALVKRGDRRKEWGFQSELDLDQWILTKVPIYWPSQWFICVRRKIKVSHIKADFNKKKI